MAPSAMELQLGGIQVFANHKLKQMQTKCDLRVQRFMHVYLQAQTVIHNAPDEPLLFWLREKPEYPQLEPHARIKMAQFLGSPV